jgi:hypothetical protein
MAAQASAQGATLTPSVSSATPGQVITVTGTGFNPTSATVQGVDIRLSTRDAEPLANINPTPQGTISVSFPLPPTLAAGEYLLIGTQVTVRGRHTFGTPGRAKIRITSAAAAAATPAEGPPRSVIMGTVLALLALSGGIAFSVRRLRAHAAQTQPQLSR